MRRAAILAGKATGLATKAWNIGILCTLHVLVYYIIFDNLSVHESEFEGKARMVLHVDRIALVTMRVV